MKYFIYIIIIMGILSMASSSSNAESVTLKPGNLQSISLKEDSSEKAFLVYFEIPEKLNSKNIAVESARLLFDACVSGDSIGEIEIYPLTTSDWSSIEKYDWTSSKENLSNIYSIVIPGKHLTLKLEDGKKTVRSNVTAIVKAWLNEDIVNKGIIITPSIAYLTNSDIKYSIDMTNARLIIYYTFE